MGAGQRHAEDRVRTELALVRRPVQVDQQGIDAGLIGRIEAQELGADAVGHVGNGRQDALAAEPRRVAVPQLDRLVGAGRGAARDRSATDRAVGQHDIDLHGRVAA
jgi:hypothetical protein